MRNKFSDIQGSAVEKRPLKAALSECSGNIFCFTAAPNLTFHLLNIRRWLIPKFQILPVVHFPWELGYLMPDGNPSVLEKMNRFSKNSELNGLKGM